MQADVPLRSQYERDFSSVSNILLATTTTTKTHSIYTIKSSFGPCKRRYADDRVSLDQYLYNGEKDPWWRIFTRLSTSTRTPLKNFRAKCENYAFAQFMTFIKFISINVRMKWHHFKYSWWFCLLVYCAKYPYLGKLIYGLLMECAKYSHQAICWIV